MKNRRNYIIMLVLILAIAGLMAWYRQLFAAEDARSFLGLLSDCFFVPGILFTGIGAIDWAATKGTYDMLGFGGGRAVRWFIPSMNKEKYENYYNYRQEKEKKGRAWHPHILISGLAAMAVTVTAFVFYYIL